MRVESRIVGGRVIAVETPDGVDPLALARAVDAVRAIIMGADIDPRLCLCSSCGRDYIREGRRAKRGQRNYCPTCRAADRRFTESYRARARALASIRPAGFDEALQRALDTLAPRDRVLIQQYIEQTEARARALAE